MSGILFFNIISDIQLFYIRSKAPVDIIRVFLISDLLAESLKGRKDHAFYSTVLLKKTSLILRTSTRLALGITQTKTFLLRCQKTTATTTKKQRKNICTAPFFEGQELHSCLHISVYLYVCISP